MRIGDIDVVNSILNLEHDVHVLQQLINFIAEHNNNLNLPSVADVEQFKQIAIQKLQEKYPTMGVTQR